MLSRTKLALLVSTLLQIQAHAHPVAFKGATGVMVWNQSFMSDYWLTYSFARNAAVAGRALRMEMPAGRFVTAFPQIDFLAYRSNNPDSQANIYFFGGAGAAWMNDVSGYAALGGIEADAESRSWFIMGKWESMKSNLSEAFHHGEFRVGLAPYEAEFNEIASWFMLQVQYHPLLVTKYAITPLYRIFYKSFLAETGVSLRGEWMANFMFHF